MSFMDKFKDVSQKAIDSTKDAANKASKFASKTKAEFEIKNDIKKKEEIVNSSYASLGANIYKKDPDYCKTNYPDIIATLVNAQNEIQKDRIALEKLKQSFKCPKCGKEIDEQTDYCIYCGEKIKKQ